MSAYYYSYKARKNGRGYTKTLTGVLLLGCALILLACVFAPSITGKLGQGIHSYLKQFSGLASFLIPLYLGWMGVRELFAEKKSRKFLDTFLFFVLFVFLSCFFSVLSSLGSGSMAGGLGGWIGEKCALFLVQQFGKFLVFVFSVLAVFVSGSLLVGVSPYSLISALKKKIAADLEDWKAERKKIKEHDALRKKLDETASKTSLAQKSPAENPVEKLQPRISKQVLLSAPPLSSPEHLKKSKVPGTGTKIPEKSAGQPEEKSCEGYLLPDAELLSNPTETVEAMSKDELYENGSLLERTLEQFHVKAKVIDIHPGPVITRYDLSPAPGVRVQAIETLANDIALAMKAQSLRVLAPIPGKGAVGVEISNPHPATVYFKEIVLSSPFQKGGHVIPFGMGRMTEGDAFVADLVSMPHLLVAGATGSGKSVSIHALILSILFRFNPDQIKLLLIDPKRLELPVYDGIPHLYDPASSPEDVRVITRPKESVQSLKKLVEVMENRYQLFAKIGVRNIESYHEKSKNQKMEPMPYLVVVIDELADLMITVGKEIEDVIQRLAQMARAVGIHLVLATQRPSVDVITGVIKANLPSRIAFQVLSKTDSRVILDSMGAEDLLGRGDMLFLASGASKTIRLQGAFVSESDVSRVVQFIKEQNFKPQYMSLQNSEVEDSIVDSDENRQLLVRAAKVVCDMEKVSGDLLRADKEIGSKYDLALTLLRKKGLIEKPKDSNRWKIYFDRLDEFLVEEERKSNQ